MAGPGRLSSISRIIQLIWLSIQFHYNALREAFRKDGLASLTRPQKIRNAAVAKVFTTTSNGFIAFEDTTCLPTLFRSARGKILELGPGAGNQLQRFDPSVVDFIYGIEPNSSYRDFIATKLKKIELQDKYKLLACGLEDSDILGSEGITEGTIDTILSIQVLCAAEDVKGLMREVWKYLKLGGSFVFWEHVKNKDTATAVAQVCLDPAWSTLVGCHLHRNIKEDILAAGEWENPGDIEVGDDPYTCMPRIWGVLRKKA